MPIYKVIFSGGYTDDDESLVRDFRGDVLLLDDQGKYYNINILTINRLRMEFDSSEVYYLESNVIILHAVNKKNILSSIKKLHSWMFYKRWAPLSDAQLEKYYPPKKCWTIFEVEV